MHATQPNDICPSVTVIRLSSISGIQPCERMGRVAAMILDMPNKMSVLVCDLYVAEVIGYGPIGNNQVSARVRTLPRLRLALLYMQLTESINCEEFTEHCSLESTSPAQLRTPGLLQSRREHCAGHALKSGEESRRLSARAAGFPPRLCAGPLQLVVRASAAASAAPASPCCSRIADFSTQIARAQAGIAVYGIYSPFLLLTSFKLNQNTPTARDLQALIQRWGTVVNNERATCTCRIKPRAKTCSFVRWYVHSFVHSFHRVAVKFTSDDPHGWSYWAVLLPGCVTWAGSGCNASRSS